MYGRVLYRLLSTAAFLSKLYTYDSRHMLQLEKKVQDGMMGALQVSRIVQS